MRELQVHDPRRVGDYALLGRLGRGAMGTVYLGRSPGGRYVAVKVARGGLAEDPDFRHRFRLEIEMARAVGGFWTAAVVGADPDADRPWLATEYVPGPTLTEAVRSGGPLPEPALRALLAGLAEALAAIHAAGLVHRDLKPSNVLLAEDGPRVIDFGIAKAVRTTALTATGVLFGTPGYLSPEQISGGEVGPPSDVFALGAVMVYAATGSGAFGDGEVAALLYRAVHTVPDLVGVPSELRPVVSRCLNPRAEARPTPADLLAEVGEAPTGHWLPAVVRTLVEQHQTEFLKPVTPRTPTLVEHPAPPAARPRSASPPTAQPAAARSTVAQSPAAHPPAAQPPVGRPSVIPPSAPQSAAAGAPAVLPPVPRSAVGRSPSPDKAPASTRRAASPTDSLRLRTTRTAPLLWTLTTGACTILALAAAAKSAHYGVEALAAAMGALAVLLGLSTIRALFRTLKARPRTVVIADIGLWISSTDGERLIPWAEISRVQVLTDRRKPWLILWLKDPATADAALGKRHSRRHGGFRLYPISHHHPKPRQSRDVLELRSSLQQHAGSAYDPTP
ncbi:serine/threonine-protein kinase [Actinokineospora diospyrosa]|uniref:Serine/threonine protein kinase n=1 Tax=Actinokineospora diospyrosa TaxID=103728 RepID=A0ABT1I9E7_9PSEU|nr:serine/threonine-protein kinase [Actinokineospora diospyrosa]MCP2269026.1 Serine/threonine protein kinase [Actinokineospora diospyrosa]